MLKLYEAEDEASWLASFRFSVDVRPRYCECDGQGHVSNVVYPAYLELSRLQYFKAAGDPEPGLFAFQHVTAELQLRYVGASFYDEPLRVASKLVALGRSSATMDQAITGADGTVRILNRVSIVRFAGDSGQPWTAGQRQALERHEGRPLPSVV